MLAPWAMLDLPGLDDCNTAAVTPDRDPRAAADRTSVRPRPEAPRCRPCSRHVGSAAARRIRWRRAWPATATGRASLARDRAARDRKCRRARPARSARRDAPTRIAAPFRNFFSSPSMDRSPSGKSMQDLPSRKPDGARPHGVHEIRVGIDRHDVDGAREPARERRLEVLRGADEEELAERRERAAPAARKSRRCRTDGWGR